MIKDEFSVFVHHTQDFVEGRDGHCFLVLCEAVLKIELERERERERELNKTAAYY